MSKSNNVVSTPLILFLQWDDEIGPRLLLQYPSDALHEPEQIGTQVFLLATTLFGPGVFEREIVDIPIRNLKVRARVFFDFYKDINIRGGRCPIVLIICYKSPSESRAIDFLVQDFKEFMKAYRDKFELIRIPQLWSSVYSASLLDFNSIDELFTGLNSVSTSAAISVVNGVMLRSSLPINLRDFATEIVSSVPNETLAPMVIEGAEYMVFWSGPLLIVLQPPIDRGRAKAMLMGMTKILDKIWKLASEDSVGLLISLLGKMHTEPQAVEFENGAARLRAIQKLKYPESLQSTPLSNANLDVIIYIRNLAIDVAIDFPNNLNEILIDHIKKVKKQFLPAFSLNLGYSTGRFFQKYNRINEPLFDDLLQYLEKLGEVQIHQKQIVVKNCCFMEKECHFRSFSRFCEGFIRAFVLDKVVGEVKQKVEGEDYFCLFQIY